jgi:hypothetical protein
MNARQPEIQEPCVFLLHWMSYDLNGKLLEGFDRDDCMLIGVYTSYDFAQEAMQRASVLAGFRNHPDHFLIDRYILNQDHWTDGFGEYNC